jgi:hypothetical protein
MRQARPFALANGSSFSITSVPTARLARALPLLLVGLNPRMLTAAVVSEPKHWPVVPPLQVWQAWPELSSTAVPFGLSGGQTEPGTDHLRASSLSKLHGIHDHADPTCATGLPVDYHSHGVVTCCAKECGVCGVSSECQLPVKNGTACPCASRPGGADACCVSTIEKSGRRCADFDPPCIVHSTEPSVCLFNVVADPEEHTNLANNSEYSALIATLSARLATMAAGGPPLASAFPADIGPINATAEALVCAQEEATQFLEPLDWL